MTLIGEEQAFSSVADGLSWLSPKAGEPQIKRHYFEA
jgi:hypothetical protein